MAKITANKTRNSIHQARIEAARAAWLEEENDAYHAQFDGSDSLEMDEKFYAGRTRSNDGEFENGIGISVGDYW